MFTIGYSPTLDTDEVEFIRVTLLNLINGLTIGNTPDALKDIPMDIATPRKRDIAYNFLQIIDGVGKPKFEEQNNMMPPILVRNVVLTDPYMVVLQAALYTIILASEDKEVLPSYENAIAIAVARKLLAQTVTIKKKATE
jgi:hypothetical protein